MTIERPNDVMLSAAKHLALPLSFAHLARCFAALSMTAFALLSSTPSAAQTQPATQPMYTLNYDTPLDPALQSKLEAIDADLRRQFDMTSEQAACGVFDLQTGRVAMIHPDHIEYGASIPKIGILFAYFTVHPEAAINLDPTVRHELGLMAKASDNDLAAKYSQQLGLKKIQQILIDAGFYDAKHGGGIWVGKHYGITGERYGDPVGDNSHGATIRQLLRYFLMLEQDQLVSPAASKTMREIFASPDIPHDDIKFFHALNGRAGLSMIRKWGDWEDWHHDCAVVIAPGRRYIVAALTKHSKGDDYLIELARRVDDAMQAP